MLVAADEINKISSPESFATICNVERTRVPRSVIYSIPDNKMMENQFGGSTCSVLQALLKDRTPRDCSSSKYRDYSERDRVRHGAVFLRCTTSSPRIRVMSFTV